MPLTQDEIVAKACKVLMCREFHQNLLNLSLDILGKGTVDPNVCEFGNDEEHKKFFGKLDASH